MREDVSILARVWNFCCGSAGRVLVRYLEKTSRDYRPSSYTDLRDLRACLRPGDVLLIEGNQRISVAIKYLTQSTWSHSAIYVGDAIGPPTPGEEPRELIEADLASGVAAVPLSKYAGFNTRICRPVGLSAAHLKRIVDFMVGKLGMDYDLKNVIDLLRYLLPMPPVPVRWRRRMLALGSGDPTRAICSTLIAQAFQTVNYPILPDIRKRRLEAGGAGAHVFVEREMLHIRHHSLFAPRDFDISPYFKVVKPTLELGFDYRSLLWDHQIEGQKRPSGKRPES